MRDRQLIGAMLAAAAVLTACGAQTDEQEQAEAPAPEEAGANMSEPAPAPPQPAPAPNASEGADSGTTIPPADAELRYVGRWAADARSCATQAWIWASRRLETPGHVVCQFEEVTPAPGGYDIEARCTAEAPPADDMIKVRFAQSAKAMLVEAKSFAPVGLVYCGPIE